MLLNGKQNSGELHGSGVQTIPLLREAPETFRYEKETTSTGRLRVKGILQKAATLNQNKRIYPLDILRREVDNYQKLIEERRSFGECVDAKTNICTVKDGWKSIADVKVGELVYTFDMATKEIRVEPVLAKTAKTLESSFYDVDIVFVRNGAGTIDMAVTPDHKMVVFDADGNPSFVTISDITTMLLNDHDSGSNKFVETVFISGRDGNLHSFHDFNIEVLIRENGLNLELFDGNVYCVTTKSGTWLAKRGGEEFWTGNCDHPESSVVELKNTSHIITKTWWQGNELWGEVEILNTDAGRNVRALFEADCTVGISSRGVGSTQHVNGADVVQGDFMLICWDFVSEPSTPNAFMFKENKEIPLALVENYFRSTGQLLHREVNRIKENYEKMRGGR